MKLFRGLTVLSLILVTSSACDMLKKKGADDGGAEGGMAAADEAGAATTPAPAAGAAANEDDIARFPDEAKLDNVAATVKRPYNVRDAPPAGAIVAGVNNGQGVSQVASRGSYFLITFDDAKQGKKLMGWVHKDAFLPMAVDAGLVEPKCAAGEVALYGDTPFCGKVCDKETACPSGQACHGSAAKWNKGKAGEAVQVCTVYAHDAGATPTDGGSKLVTTLDAGGLTTAIDAGGGSGLPAQTALVQAPTNGKCADNAAMVKKDSKCHLKCPQASVCGSKGFCGKCDGVAVCNEVRNFCGN